MAMQSNLAYDFERFETQRRAPEQKPKLRVVEKKRQARQTRHFVMKAAACITVFFAGILGIIFSQVAITEVTMQITSSTQELELLQSDYRTLSAELESSTALSNIETVATREMGMSKLREDQVTYVSFSDGDSVDEVENLNPSLLDQLKAAVSSLMEYINPSENTME